MEGGLILTVALVVIKLLGWFYQIQLANIFGGEGNGYYSTAYDLFSIVYAVAVTGFPVALSKIVSEYATQGRYKDVQRAERVSGKLLFGVGIVSVVFLIFFAQVYVQFMTDQDDKLLWVIWAFIPAILFCCMMSVQRGYNQGLNNMTPTAVSQVIETVVKVAVGLAGAYFARNYFQAEYQTQGTVVGSLLDPEQAESLILALSGAGAMLGVTASSVASWLFLRLRRWWVGSGIRKADLNASPEPYASKDTLKRILLFAIPISLSAATANLSGLIDTYVVLQVLERLLDTVKETVFASFGEDGDLLQKAGISLSRMPMFIYGTYRMHNKIITLIPTITGSFGMSALPLISSNWANRDMLAAKKNINTSLRLTMLIAAPAGMGIAFLAEPISWLVYSKNPIEAAMGIPMLKVMGIVAIFMALMGIVNAMLQAIGRTDVPIKLLVIGLVLKAVTNYLLVSVPSINVRGVPYGNLLFYAFISLMGIMILARSTGLKLDMTGTLIKPMVAGILTGATAWGIYMLIYRLLENSKWSTVIAILCAIAVYVVFIGLFRLLDRDDVLSMPGGKKLVAVLEKLKVIR